MLDSHQLARETNNTLIGFIKAEISTGMVFATIAADAGQNADKRIRNTTQAQRAYDGALHFLRRARLSEAEANTIASKLAELKATLEKITHQER